MTSRKPRTTRKAAPRRRPPAPAPASDVTALDVVVEDVEVGQARVVGQRLDELVAERNGHTVAVLAIRRAVRSAATADHELRGTVLAARHLNVSWREIGIAAGMTGRGAQKRWGA